MPWLALTLEVDAASADALGDALLAAGALSITVDEPEAPSCRLSALLAVHADPEGVLSEAASACGMATLPGFDVARVEDDDWVRRSQAQFLPFAVGERLWVGPSWQQPPADSAAAILRIDPGLAFGTGSHPSTRLVLEFLAEAVAGGERVLDYGCGSGILALAAARLGAAKVDAVDIDPQSIETAAANAALNHIQLRAALPDALPPGVYDVVVANILAQPLVLLAPVLAARAASGARIALSGILATQAGEVAAAYDPFFATSCRRSLDGWSLVEGLRR
jgi:ribosomal protein L11 methyltransferase